jgi:F like protein
MYDSRVKRALRLVGVGTENAEEGTRECNGDEPSCAAGLDITKQVLDVFGPEFGRCFDSLGGSFPFAELQALLERGLPNGDEGAEDQQATVLEDVDLLLDTWNLADESPLGEIVARIVVAISAQVFLAFATHWLAVFKMKNVHVGGLPARLRESAQSRIAKAAEAVRRAIRRAVKAVIKAAVKAGRRPKDIVSEVRAFLENGDRVRKVVEDDTDDIIVQQTQIAGHEVNATLEATHKRWVVLPDGQACYGCRRNAGQGDIPLDQPFVSGHMHPRAHPNCRCHLRYSGVTKESLLRALAEA